jgi:hypothetical protein
MSRSKDITTNESWVKVHEIVRCYIAQLNTENSRKLLPINFCICLYSLDRELFWRRAHCQYGLSPHSLIQQIGKKLTASSDLISMMIGLAE